MVPYQMAFGFPEQQDKKTQTLLPQNNQKQKPETTNKFKFSL
jgi:hypothetical protein